MNTKTRLGLLLLSFTLMGGGSYLVMAGAGFKALVGVLAILWASNISNFFSVRKDRL